MKWNSRRVPRDRNNVLKFPQSRNSRTSGKAKFAALFTGIVVVGSVLGWQAVDKRTKFVHRAAMQEPGDVGCAAPLVVDGDTLRCSGRRIRLAAIDAPEKPGHCSPGRHCVEGDPIASSRHLKQLVDLRTMKCRQTDTDRYGRIVARCSVEGQDLSCAQVKGGYAVERYGSLDC
jgi:endonuclease YncB( thermonuclease family)